MDERIADLLIAWEEAWEQGRELSAAELCAECPELAADLQSKIDSLKKMAWMDHSTPEPPFSPPSMLAKRYKVEGYIAEGGFGYVYRGFDPKLDRQVAIKFA